MQAKNHFLAVVLTLVCAGGTSGQVSLNIDKSVRYQTIEGIGASVTVEFPIVPWKERQGPFYVDVDLEQLGFYDSIITQLGCTGLRTDIRWDFEAVQGVKQVSAGMSALWDVLRRVQAAAARHNESVRVLGAVWSPPGWMKVSGTPLGGIEAAPNYFSTDCRLLDNYDDTLGRYLADYVSTMTDSGISYYAISLQNEPAFQEPYGSCVYNGARMVTATKAVGRALADAGLPQKLFGCEHMSWAFPNSFENFIRQDPEALGYMQAWSVHGYTDGVRADTGAFGGATPTDKPLWMTETSGPGYGSTLTDWSGAMVAARNMLSYFRTAKISWWTWWTLQVAGESQGDVEYAIHCAGKPTMKWYVTSHFARYIRPGARQVASTSSTADVQVGAFWHEENQCLSIVLVNTASSSRTVNSIAVNGGSAPLQYEKITSDQSAQIHRSTVAATDQIVLPANSITTLVSGAYRGTGALTTAPQPAATAVRNASPQARSNDLLFGIDGRVAIRRIGRAAPGVLVSKTDGSSTVRMVIDR